MKACHYCEKICTSVALCSRCRLVRYCDRTCQKNDWASHKAVCTPPIRTLYTTLKKEIQGKKICEFVVTLDDVENNLAIMASFIKFSKTGEENEDKEESLMDAMVRNGATEPFRIKHNDIAVLPSKIHGHGVFATKAIPADVIVSFYPCDAIYNTQTTALSIYPRDDGLDLSLTDVDIREIANDYKFMHSRSHHLGIIGNPRRRNNSLLLGHLINDGASDVFAGLNAEKLKKKELLYSLLVQYTKETTASRNCLFCPSADESVVCIVTSRPIQEGEELLLSYSSLYWLQHHYGWDMDEKYPFIAQYCKNMPIHVYSQLQY